MTYRYVREIRVDADREEEFIEAWYYSSLAIQCMPGARGTRLHRKRGEDGVFIAIAEWESKDARDAAFEELHKPDNPHGIEMRRWPDDRDFGEVTILGRLDEIKAALPPSRSKHIIPGHVRAQTWWVALAFAIATFCVTSSVAQAVGAVLLVFGMFLGDQATHLGQENHQGVQSTWIEEQMQSHRVLFVILGFFVSLGGLLLMVAA